MRFLCRIYAGVFLCYSVFLTFVSPYFNFDYTLTDRPVILFTVIHVIAGLACFAMALKIFFHHNGQKAEISLPLIVSVFVLSRLIVMFSSPILENDVYRYVWDGMMSVTGENPYALSPASAFEAGQPYASDGSAVYEVFRKINYPQIPTIYPPVSQLFFAVAQWFDSWGLTGWRFLVFTAELIMLAVLAVIVGNLKLNSGYLIMYAWNPLVLKEYANSLHLDVLAVLFTVAWIAFVLRKRWELAWAALGLAVLSKWYALMLIPLAFSYQLNFSRIRRVLSCLLIPAVMTAVFYYPYCRSDIRLFTGTAEFAGYWQVNDSVFSLIQALIRYAWNGLEDPQVNFYSRIITGLMIVAAVMYATLKLRSCKFQDLVRMTTFVLALIFFLAPTGNPWYFTWVIPFAILNRSAWIFFASALVGLYYLDFHLMYHEMNPALYDLMRICEYLPVYLMLLWVWNRKRQSA